MKKRVTKYFIQMFIISCVIILSLIFLIKTIFELKEYRIYNTEFSVENEDLLATVEINESSANAKNFTAPIKDSTVWPIENITIYTNNNLTSTTGKQLKALTECIVTDVSNYAFKVKYITNGKKWQDSNATFAEGWVDAHRLLINMPDVCSDIEYNITNAKSSIFKIGSGSNSVNIPNLTGKQLYTYDNYDGELDGKIYNSKIGRKEYVCPLIYPFAEEVANAQKIAKNKGYNLKIYDGYRPQKDVCNMFWTNTQTAMNNSSVAYNLINKNGWTLGWFVANPNSVGSSDHARGTAIDVTLTKNGKEVVTPSDMHDLSTNSVKTTSPTNNYNIAPEQAKSTEETRLLHQIMVNEAGLGGLPSEWWHFNTRSGDYNTHFGDYNVTYTDKGKIAITKVEFSPDNSTVAKERTVTITANKDIKTVSGTKSGNWTVNGKFAKFVYKNNITNDVVTITDKDGNKVTKNITISNIDNSVDIISQPVNMPNRLTNGNVTVIINANEPLSKVTGGTGTWSINEKNKYQALGIYSNNTNGKEIVRVEDQYGNFKDIEVNVTNIDKNPPRIINIQKCILNNQVLILVTADKEIETVYSNNAISKNTNVTQENINQMKGANSNINVDMNALECCAILTYSKNSNEEIIEIEDLAGNRVKSDEIKIDGIDDKGPELKVTYEVEGKQYNNSNYTTNKNVKVIITANEDIKAVSGWDLSSDKRTLTKIYSDKKTENIIVKDLKGNSTTQKIYIKIDRQAPYLSTKPITITNLSDGIVRITVALSEQIAEINGTGWNIHPSGILIYKDFIEVTSEERETITVKDSAGNEYSFTIVVTEENSEVTARISDEVAPILEEIRYGITTPTSLNVKVEMIINEKVTTTKEGWTLLEGTGEDENKWILRKIYDQNVIEDKIEIEDIDGNKIVGTNETQKYVEDGKVTISVTNIDRVSPIITLEEHSKINENVNVILKANERLKSTNNSVWKITNSNTNAKISGTIAKGTSEILKVQDEAGNVTCVKITADVLGDNVTVTKGSILEQINYSPKQSRKTNKNVTVTIQVNNEIGKINNKPISIGSTVDGWTLREGVGTSAGKGIIEKVYTENAEDEVQIEDIEGNKIIGEDINNGKVKIAVTNIDKEYEEKEISSIEIVTNPNKTVYYQGEMLDLNGLSLNLKDANGNIIDTIEYEDNNNEIEVALYGSNKANTIMLLQPGEQQRIVVYYEDKTTYFFVTVNKVQVESIAIKDKPTKLNYKVGEELDTTGLSIEVTYNNGRKEVITQGFTVEQVLLDTIGTIDVCVEYEGQAQLFKVTVEEEAEKTIKRVTIKEWPNRNKEYIEGQSIDTSGLVLEVLYSDGTIEDITEGYVVEPIVLKKGAQLVKISYGNEVIQEIIIAKEKEITELKLLKVPDKTIYNIGMTIDLTGIQLEVTYNNGEKEIVENIDNLTYMPNELTEPGKQIIKVYCNGHEEKTVEFEVTVNDVEIVKIEAIPDSSKVYYKGDKINTNFLKVIATFNDGTTDDITGYTITPEILENAGEQQVTVKFREKTATFIVNVKDATVENIRIKDKPDKETFVIGETLNKIEDLIGLVVEAQYSDGGKQDIPLEDLEIEEVQFNKEGVYEIKVTYKEKEASFNVNVRKMKFQILSIKQLPQKLEYNKGDKLDVMGLQFTVRDEYNEIKTIDASLYNEITYSPMILNEVGTQTIIVQHENDSSFISFDVNVKEKQNDNSDNQDNEDKEDDTNKDDNVNNGDNTNKDNNANKDNNIEKNENISKDNTTAPEGYKDANTATSRLPQTGVTQIALVILGICTIVSGMLYIKYRKI